jgi:hypothetical protein
VAVCFMPFWTRTAHIMQFGSIRIENPLFQSAPILHRRRQNGRRKDDLRGLPRESESGNHKVVHDDYPVCGRHPIDVPLITTALSTVRGRSAKLRRIARSIRLQQRQARQAERAYPRVPAAAAVRRRENTLRAAVDQLRSMKPALVTSWRCPLCWLANSPCVSSGCNRFNRQDNRAIETGLFYAR